MSESNVTIVVVPRERFSYTQQSLESIYQNTGSPFTLVYVDGNSPSRIKRYLEAQSREKGFSLVRTDDFLSPNQARNLGLSHVETKYVVFIDNDVLVKPGWLEKLVARAEETGAWLVGPLTLLGSDFKTVHMAGGTIGLQENNGRNQMTQKRPIMNRSLAKVQDQIKPGYTGLLEFHCMLARTEVFDQLGHLDENLMSMCEEDDLCMAVAATGNRIYFEPGSVVSYVAPSPADFDWSDLPYFFLRWSDAWCRQTISRCIEKWKLTEDSPFLANTKYFVRAHRVLVNPRPEGVLNYTGYAMKRLFIMDIARHIMDWKARRLVSRVNPGPGGSSI